MKLNRTAWIAIVIVSFAVIAFLALRISRPEEDLIQPAEAPEPAAAEAKTARVNVEAELRKIIADSGSIITSAQIDFNGRSVTADLGESWSMIDPKTQEKLTASLGRKMVNVYRRAGYLECRSVVFHDPFGSNRYTFTL